MKLSTKLTASAAAICLGVAPTAALAAGHGGGGLPKGATTETTTTTASSSTPKHREGHWVREKIYYAFHGHVHFRYRWEFIAGRRPHPTAPTPTTTVATTPTN
jgi:hypothetical protein